MAEAWYLASCRPSCLESLLCAGQGSGDSAWLGLIHGKGHLLRILNPTVLGRGQLRMGWWVALAPPCQATFSSYQRVLIRVTGVQMGYSTSGSSPVAWLPSAPKCQGLNGLTTGTPHCLPSLPIITSLSAQNLCTGWPRSHRSFWT